MWNKLVLFLIFAIPVLAGNDRLVPADVLGTVLDVVRSDWNGDGVLDRAVLWQPQRSSDLANLFVFLSAKNGKPRIFTAAGVAWSRFGGQEAWLEPDPRGFSVLSGGSAENTRWQEGLAIIFDAAGPRVAGYSYHSYAAAENEKDFVCTADYVAGRGSRNGAEFAIVGGAPLLNEWSYRRIPVPCRAR